MKHIIPLLPLAAAAQLAASISVVSDARACGGFFCSQVPVLQTAEQVVFEIEGDEITAYIKLQYEGDDPSFAWIVPVPETPEVEVGVGQEMFDALEDQTAPRFSTMSGEASAVAQVGPSGCGGGGGFFGGSFDSGDPRLVSTLLIAPEVDVLAEKRVGPYDVAVLDATNAFDVNDWLRINGYRVLPGSEQIVQSYLDVGMKLLALKLAPEVGSNAVEPLKLTYRDSRGCAEIPIRLTAIAARPGLEIITWVFGSARAVPENYAPVEVDPAELSSADDYGSALSAAVDAAPNGHGFVTEFAQPTATLSDRNDPTLGRLLRRHLYVTRLRTELDPEEMTLDPAFTTDRAAGDVSNVIEIGGPTARQASGAFFVLVGAGYWLRRRRS